MRLPFHEPSTQESSYAHGHSLSHQQSHPGGHAYMSEIADRCRNHWTPILGALSVLDEKALRHRDGPCPVCGGRDRFRYTDKGYGRSYCRGCCMGGDGVALVEHVMGIDFAEAARLIERVIGATRYCPKVDGDHRNTD